VNVELRDVFLPVYVSGCERMRTRRKTPRIKEKEEEGREKRNGNYYNMEERNGKE